MYENFLIIVCEKCLSRKETFMKIGRRIICTRFEIKDKVRTFSIAQGQIFSNKSLKTLFLSFFFWHTFVSFARYFSLPLFVPTGRDAILAGTTGEKEHDAFRS